MALVRPPLVPLDCTTRHFSSIERQPPADMRQAVKASDKPRSGEESLSPGKKCRERKSGRSWQARTADQRIKSPLLYQLS